MRLVKARDIMVKNVRVVKTDDHVTEVIRCFVDEGVSSAVVVDDENKVRGIITDGDILAAVRRRRPVVVDLFSYLWVAEDEGDLAAKSDLLKKKKVKELMTKHVITVTEDTVVPEIARLMVENNIKQVPVVRNGRIVGLVRRQDVLKAVAEVGES